MNQAKLNILKDTFEKKFDIERFQKFTREFFNEPTILPGNRKVGIWREYDNYINSYYLIANYKDGDNNSILVMAVELKRNISVEKARSMQRNFISKVLYENNYEAAIVAFYTEDSLNWRLSLVRLDYSLTSTGIKLDLTPAKRYSYLVGEGEPNNTAQTQLLKIFEDDEHNPTLEEIEEAFSVEKVTKDFFDSYKEKYLDLKEHLEKTDSFISEAKKLGFKPNKFAEQFSKKLMGQLAFLYFLQKKGWLGVRLLPKDRTLSQEEFKEIYTLQTQDKRNVLTKAFKQDIDGSFKSSATYLHELSEDEAGLLSDCFINTKYNMPWGSGDKKFIIELFNFCNDETDLNFFHDYLEPFFYDALNKNRVNDYYKRFNCKIPFLNGGLFEPLEGYHWKDIGLKIPNYIFSNEKENGREADGILDVFERYNFTMNEDEPLDKEVAIDPEMLGKIFENLLEVSDRKSKGAFYTPREIVHYMCQESIINYLVNSTGVPYEDMKEFILYGEMIKDADNRRAVISGSKELAIKPSIYDNIVDIDAALRNVKIADPAVGSGAFPLGMLNEIVKARKNITEYIIKVNKEGEFGEKYDEKFIRSRRSEYTMKIDTIKNSIFAVDIEPSAVDIAKLRLWLSVVVDQEINENNPKPHVLPNLDENIKVGNSLIDEFEGIELFDKSILNKDSSKGKNMDLATQMNLLLDSSDILINQMFTLQESYFNEDDESRKQELKIKIDKIRNDLIEYKLQRDGNIEGLRKYEESFKNKTKPYFIWELEFARVFKENWGFDIVIGNPPYIDSEEMTKNLASTRDYCKTKFISAKGNWDIFVVFIEQGLKILKKGGTISYIVPNKFIGAKYTEGLRYMLSEYNIQEIRDYSDVNVFEEADVYPMVFRIEKSDKKDYVNTTIMIDLLQSYSSNLIKPSLFYRDIYWDRYLTKRQETISIIDKILNGEQLDKIATVRGAATVSEAYEIKKFLIDKANSSSFNQDNSKKFINTGTIDRYVSLWGIKDTRYIKDSYKEPVMLDDSFKNFNSSRLLESNKPKIIIGGMTKYLECYLDEGEYLAGKSTTIIYDSKISLIYLICILNSRLMSFYYSNYYKSLSLNGGYFRIGPPQIKEMPIIINASYKDILEEQYANLLLSIDKNEDMEIDRIEKQIDVIVYEIYGLSKEEISVIETDN